MKAKQTNNGFFREVDGDYDDKNIQKDKHFVTYPPADDSLKMSYIYI